MMQSTQRQQMQVGASFQNFTLKTQTISVPDDHGILRYHPTNDYQVKAVRSILTGEPMSLMPASSLGQQPSLGSLPSTSSQQSSTSSIAQQQQPQQQQAAGFYPVIPR